VLFFDIQRILSLTFRHKKSVELHLFCYWGIAKHLTRK